MLNFFEWMRTLSPGGRKATELYGSIVAQARRPVFYRDFGISDTAPGRYETIVLHLALVLAELKSEGPAADRLRRSLVERFVTDVDDSLRQLAVGDMSVPRKVKKAAAGLKERVAIYNAAMQQPGAEPEAAMAAALERIFGEAGSPLAPGQARALARYSIACTQRTLLIDGVLGGCPDPAEFAPDDGSAEAVGGQP